MILRTSEFFPMKRHIVMHHSDSRMIDYDHLSVEMVGSFGCRQGRRNMPSVVAWAFSSFVVPRIVGGSLMLSNSLVCSDSFSLFVLHLSADVT